MYFRTSLLLLVFFQLFCCLAQADNFSLRGYKGGDPLPSFNATSIDDRSQLSFSPKGDGPAVILFFSLRPLFRQRRSLDLITKVKELIDQEFAGRVRLSLIYSDNKEVDILRKFISDGLIPSPVFDDNTRDIYNKFGVFMTPIVVLSTEKGNLHEVIPASFNIQQVVRNNLRLLLGDFSQEEFKNSFKPTYNKKWTKEEKEYLRRINYGKIMYGRKMYSPAIREFSTAAKITPNNYEAQLGLGQVFLKTKNYQEALTSFDQALKINPDSNEALAGKGITYFQMGNTEEAVTILENALITENADLDVIISLAKIYEARGEIRKAIRLNKMAVLVLQKQVD